MNSRISQVAQPNQGAIADIAFLLLIFFMVATTIVEDEGILVELPQWDAPVVETGSDNVLAMKVNAQNNYMVDGARVDIEEIPSMVTRFVLNPSSDPGLPSNPRKAVISLQTDRGTRYDAYISVYDAIRASYSTMRENLSEQLFGKSYEILSPEQQKQIRYEIPIVLSEAEATTFGEMK